MAFSRFTTKLKQTVTDAEKTETDPALKEGLRQFEETTKFGDNIKDAAKEALPNIAAMGKTTKNENLGALIKQAAAKYGTEKPEAAGLLQAGEILMAIGKEERVLLQEVEQNAYSVIKATHEYHESLKKEKSRLQNTATDMDGAKIKYKSNSSEQNKAKVEATTRAYHSQLAKVIEMVGTLSEHRDRQRQAVKALLEAKRDFYQRAAGVIEGAIANVG